MFDRHNKSMQLKFKTSDILAKLRANRALHVAEHVEAMAGYKLALEKELKRKLSALRKGTIPSSHINLVKPTSYEAEYNRAEAMYAMTTETEVQLDQELFQQLILDEWAWSSQSKALNTSYIGAAR